MINACLNEMFISLSYFQRRLNQVILVRGDDSADSSLKVLVGAFS